jgi:hypothetical protein
MNLFYYCTKVKILWRGLLAKAGIRGTRFLLFLLPMMLMVVSSSLLQAQESVPPWRPAGGNLQITNNLSDDFLPSVAFRPGFTSGGNIYFVVWARKTSSGFDIYGARVTTSGQVLDEGGIPISTAPNDQMLPTVLWGGDNFFVVWEDRRSGKRWEIHGARVTPEGEVLDPEGIPIAKGKSSNDQAVPSVAFDGVNYIVVWQGYQKGVWNIYFSRVSKSGEVLEEKPFRIDPSTDNQVYPAVAFDGQGSFIVWQDFRGGKLSDIYGAKITPRGEFPDLKVVRFRITYGDQFGSDQWNPTISWNDSHHFVVWMASVDGINWNLYGKRAGRDGEILDPADVPIEKDGANKVFPALLWDGMEHVIAWEEEPEEDPRIFVASVLPENLSQPGQRILVSSSEAKDASMPAISVGRDSLLAVWQARNQEGYWNLYGQLLSRSKD